MKIERSTPALKRVDELEAGDVFESEGGLFVRCVSYPDEQITAARLQDGKIVYFTRPYLVTPRKGVFVLED